ncbi:type I DNA topoisomerase [bacterium]|nr:type I DNA topoisomerase [bacterium]
MSAKLVIVESPTKARTLRKILGQGYIIKASMGHIVDLPRQKLGIDLKNKYKPTYVLLPEKEQIVQEIKKAAQTSDCVYLAPDPDREGEAIAWHLARVLGQNVHTMYRVQFQEITQQAVLKAFEQPGKINQNKVSAQQARRILDRLVGYKVSPFLWKKVQGGLSAGRVQSVALRLICEREREISAFSAEEFWTIQALFRADKPPDFQAKLIKYDQEKIKIRNSEQAEQIKQELQLHEHFTCSQVSAHQHYRPTPPPLITSTLQQEAYKRYHFPAQKTMTLAQRLYEGKEIGEKGPIGLITYMRTDSVRLSPEFIDLTRDYLGRLYGPDYVPKKPPAHKNRSTTQDAHEAIRPTSVERTPDSIRPYLSRDEAELYALIWSRAVASQMPPALFAQTFAELCAGPFTFLAQGKVQLFDGYLRILDDIQGEQNKRSALSDSSKDKPLPPLERGDRVIRLAIENKQQFTQPPPRYNEATLIKELEKHGIGRPSTYASIVHKMKEQSYTSMEKDRFVPTQLGFVVIDLLLTSFPELFTITFTAQMEKKLDLIEAGQREWLTVIQDFYLPFESELKKASDSLKKSESEQKPVREETRKKGDQIAGNSDQGSDNTAHTQQCPRCQSLLRIKKGKYGDFLGCSAYPTCRYTCSISAKKPAVPKATQPESQYLPCYLKGCSGKIVQRTSKKGTTFFGCSRYPACSALLWKEPVLMKCPECGSPVVLKKALQKFYRYTCPRPECGHSWKEPRQDSD